MLILLVFEAVAVSTVLYYYLHTKTRISLKYLYQDNAAVILATILLCILVERILPNDWDWVILVLCPGVVLGIAFTFTMIRFWRTPTRRITAKENEIVCPADGNIIYITRVEAGDVPVSIKGKRYSRLGELTKTDILDKPCWLIGINMTPFDVHKNCAPINGQVILNQHFDGKFLSLKDDSALTENERNTYVISDSETKIGIVQIASRLVRRIDSYVKQGAQVKKGEWLGMIRFGSQVDVVIPIEYEVIVKINEQTYAGETIIARK
jgi:phosphatidylserine decarboxylase